MRILNFGSLNCDYVYQVPHITAPAETLSAREMQVFPGGKGLNQSIALARAGAPVFHAGLVGEDGDFLVDLARESGVDCRYLERRPGRTGHAIIQVEDSGQNAILICGGANQLVDEPMIRRVLADFGPGDLLLAQNEVSGLPLMLSLASDRGMTVALNPSPCGDLPEADLSMVDWLILNEVEGAALSGETEIAAMPDALRRRYPQANILLTLGAEGAVCLTGEERHFQPAIPVKTVDTTAAGDTFTGYFLAAVTGGQTIPEALLLAAQAAAIAVSRPGASSSIPTRQEVENRLW